MLKEAAVIAAAFFAGKQAKEKEILENDNEILRKQRDNNVYSITDADRVWDEWEDK